MFQIFFLIVIKKTFSLDNKRLTEICLTFSIFENKKPLKNFTKKIL